MRETLTVTLRNAVDAIPAASDSADAWLEAHRGSPAARLLVALAIEELVTNCIKYGYDDDREHTIGLELVVTGGVLSMTMVDDGRAFDPLATPRPDLSTPVDDRPVGGLGLHLLQELADRLTYERRDGTNRITIVTRLDGTASAPASS